MVSGSDDKTIKIWDVENQTCSQTIRDDNIACVLRAHRGHLFSGSFKYVKVRLSFPPTFTADLLSNPYPQPSLSQLGNL